MRGNENRRILIVDDEPLMRELLREMLGGPGVVIAEAETLAEARHRLAKTPFDLVTLDNGLPDGNGVDLVREARARCPRVIMVTSDGHGKVLRERALGLGAETVFAKPFDIVKLVRHVRGGGA